MEAVRLNQEANKKALPFTHQVGSLQEKVAEPLVVLRLHLLNAMGKAQQSGVVTEGETNQCLQLLDDCLLATRQVVQAAQQEVFHQSRSQTTGRLPNLDLTPREIDILRHLAMGQPNKEIARALDVMEGTVKVHIKTILRKLKFSNRTQAAIFAYECGLIENYAGEQRSARG